MARFERADSESTGLAVLRYFMRNSLTTLIRNQASTIALANQERRTRGAFVPSRTRGPAKDAL